MTWWLDRLEPDVTRCLVRICKSPHPVKLFLSSCGHPTFIDGVGCITVGVYTIDATLRQLLEDIGEADRERRRGRQQ